jgi:hypothetical protein
LKPSTTESTAFLYLSVKASPAAESPIGSLTYR